MKRIIYLIALMFVCGTATAQTQKGIVVESSITSVKRQPLQGVTLKIRGNTNAVVTDKNGAFSFAANKQNEGERYILTSIYKKGYELADPSMIGRPIPYSSKVPLQVVLLSSKILNERKIEMENRIYKSTQTHYNTLLSSLNDSLANGMMAMEAFVSKSQSLQQQFDAYEPLISALSDHYVRMDYDKMAPRDIEVCTMIMEGEIERADSLISILEKELKAKKEEHMREKEDISNDLYNKYAIALARFETAKAGEYIYLRSQVDSTDVDCLLEAGAFACDYESDYVKAGKLYDNALRYASVQYGEESEKYALCLNHKGGLMLAQSMFKKALECRQQALEIRINIYGELHTSVAACYNNLANIYYSTSQLEKAKECAEKAVYIYQHVEDCIASDYTTALNTLGGINLACGEWDFATTLFEDAIKISEEQYGYDNIHSAGALNDLAVLKDYQGKFEESIPLYIRAINIYKKVYGEHHPSVATLYSNLGDSYKQIQKYDSAMVYHSNALEMRLDLFGEHHEDIATSLNNIGSLFSAMGQYDTAIEYYGKCLGVWESILCKDNPHFAITIGNMGVLYYRQKKYDMALPCFEEALAIYVKTPENYARELKSLGELAAMCYYYLEQDENLNPEQKDGLKTDFEEFKKIYSIYILPEEK